jgi:hypothetical protein
MKRIFFFVAFFAGVACKQAQYTLIKSADGVLVVSNVPGRKFSVDVPGSNIVPYGLKQADHPFLTADNRLLQIMSVPLAQFRADPKASDEIILRKQMEYETNFCSSAAECSKDAAAKARGRAARHCSGRSRLARRCVARHEHVLIRAMER